MMYLAIAYVGAFDADLKLGTKRYDEIADKANKSLVFEWPEKIMPEWMACNSYVKLNITAYLWVSISASTSVSIVKVVPRIEKELMGE